MSSPKRIQRRRTAGWRMPEGAVYVGRPTRWGNPYVVHQHSAACNGDGQHNCPEWAASDRDHAVQLYRHGVLYPVREQAPGLPTAEEIRRDLAGKDLACFCPLDQPCHADFLLAVANGEVADGRA